MAYANDTKPTGSYTNDGNANVPLWDDSRFAWDSALIAWDGALPYGNDSKPSGSYSNDLKPA